LFYLDYFLAFLYRFDQSQRDQGIQPTTGCWKIFSSGYFWRALIAYIFAFILTTVMILVMNRGQPALLYLVPFTIGVTVITGLIRKELKSLWKGDSPISRPVDELQLLHSNPEENGEEEQKTDEN